MRHKTFELVEAKAENDELGTFTALASVFRNVDLAGDRILPGAFTNTLKQWREKGHPIPVILSHSWDDPFASIGYADPNDVTETSKGLVVKGTLDVTDNDVARQVYKLMKRGTLRGWSFGYTVPEGGEKFDAKGVNNVKEVDLIEVGPTLKGANPEAQLQSVKSALEQMPLPEPVAERVRAQLLQMTETMKNGDTTIEKMMKMAKTLTAQLQARPIDTTVSAVEDGKDEEPGKAKSAPQDPLRKRSFELALDIASGGTELRAPIEQEQKPEPLNEAALRRRTLELAVEVHSGK